MEAWTMATGIHFVQSVTADLVFDDEDLGNAYASFNLDNMGGTNANGTALIVDASINIGKDWIEDDWTLNDGVDLDSYSFQTYIHEIGHALGLGHAGPYNGSADYTQFRRIYQRQLADECHVVFLADREYVHRCDVCLCCHADVG